MGYEFKVLPETASPTDMLEDQTHQKSAQKIYELIKSSDSGLTIGLEGAWGSGKSTVINLLRNEVQKNTESNDTIFVFDAWAHEGDPLRRAFLEDLINCIDRKNLKLKEIADKISGRLRTTRITSRKSATRLGKILAFLVLLTPLGNILINKTDFTDLAPPLSHAAGSIAWLPIIGSIPWLAIPLLMIGWAFLGDRDKDKKVIWDIFSNEIIEKSTQEISEDGKITTLEFEESFNEIVLLATEEKSNAEQKNPLNRIIIVIDNLDRASADTAKNIISTLQIFLQTRENQQAPIRKHIWFVIPYDLDTFLSIWKKAHDNDEHGATFIDKIFQIRVCIPTPIFSSWAKYCQNCIDSSLTNWNESDKRIVIDEFLRLNSNLSRSPTPRKIRSFVNQVGMNAQYWGGIVSTEAISIYAHLRLEKSESTIRSEILKNELPLSHFSPQQAGSIQQEIAGMLFGAPKEKGLQLLFGPIIKSALTTGDGEPIKSLEQNNPDAFWIAWNSTYSDNRPSVSHVEDYKISYTKALYFGLSHARSKIVKETKDVIYCWTNSSYKWEIGKYQYSGAMECLIALSDNSPEIVETLSTATEEHLKKVGDLIKQSAYHPQNLAELKNIIDTLTKHGGKIKKDSYGNLNWPEWMNWLSIQNGANLALTELIPAAGAIRAAADEFTSNSSIRNNNPDNPILSTLRLHKNSEEWSFMSKSIVGLLQSYRSQDLPLPKTTYSFVKEYSHLCDEKYASDLLRYLSINTPQIANH